MIIQQKGTDVHILNIGRFSLADTLDCGQCFRWDADENGVYSGITGNYFMRISQSGDTLIFYNTDTETVKNIFVPYFDLDRDYDAIAEELKKVEPKLIPAEEFAPGIRIMAQQPWETLCSFIISQNNNIPRIKGIISRLCENFGEKIEGGFTFPSADVTAKLDVDALAPLRCGFRAKYIIDAAKKVSGGVVDLESLRTLDIAQARTELMKICGVGPKVAECTLLYGLGRLEAFPVDVWMKRVMAEYFPNGTPLLESRYAGVAQQYLFHRIRNEKKSAD